MISNETNNGPKGGTLSEATDPSNYAYTPTSHANLVRRASNGVYYVRAKVGGKKIFKSTETAVEKQATAKRDEILKAAREANEAGIESNKSLTFSGAIEIYKTNLTRRVKLGEHRHKGGIQPNTQTSYLGALAKILSLADPAYLNRKLDKFSTEILQAWIEPVRLEFGATLYNTCTVVFRDVFEIGVKAKFVLVNPATRLEHETPKKKNFTLPTLDQWHALIHEIRTNKLNRRAEHSADVTEFLTYTGARITEATLLRKTDARLDRNLVHFREGTTKNGQEKYVPILAPCLPILKKWLEQPRDEKQLLLPIKSVRKAVANACARLGIPHLTQHDFRHLFASQALEITKDARVVSEWLGHRDGGKLLGETYSHVSAEWSQKEAAKITFKKAA